MNTVEVWTDGSCSGNPGPMGIGVVVIDGERRREAGVSLGEGTSNIAELRAIEHGILLALDLTGDPTRPMRVHSDSQYAIGMLSKKWKAKANIDLVARLRAMLVEYPNVTFVKVRGHAGVAENERCDELATAASGGTGTATAAPIDPVAVLGFALNDTLDALTLWADEWGPGMKGKFDGYRALLVQIKERSS